MSGWTSVAKGMPDDDTSVMIYAPREDEPVWIGYHDGEVWRLASGETVKVSHWQEMPEPPFNGKEKA